MKIDKNIPIPQQFSLEVDTVEKMEIGDSIYFEGKYLGNTEVQRYARAFKKLGYKYTSRQIYDYDAIYPKRKVIGIRLWRIE
tara:strand:- start:1640 stop:1885 length:246 start_codon:yes stop_codon:yes gene_type:complete